MTTSTELTPEFCWRLDNLKGSRPCRWRLMQKIRVTNTFGSVTNTTVQWQPVPITMPDGSCGPAAELLIEGVAQGHMTVHGSQNAFQPPWILYYRNQFGAFLRFSFGAGPPKEYHTLAEAEAAAQKLSQEYLTVVYVMGVQREVEPPD